MAKKWWQDSAAKDAYQRASQNAQLASARGDTTAARTYTNAANDIVLNAKINARGRN